MSNVILGGTCLATFVIASLLVYWFNRRQQRMLREENSVRARLGLPPLTRSQFAVTVVKKSDEFRANVNQHM